MRYFAKEMPVIELLPELLINNLAVIGAEVRSLCVVFPERRSSIISFLHRYVLDPANSADTQYSFRIEHAFLGRHLGIAPVVSKLE